MLASLRQEALVGQMLLLFLGAALAQAASQPRGPDSHDLRREPGDAIMVDGRPEAAAPPQVRFGRYVAPCPGWVYSRLRPGQRLRSAFTHSRYMVPNPAQLGLSAATAGRHWIRYGDDAVLVESWNRRVIQVVPDRYR